MKVASALIQSASASALAGVVVGGLLFAAANVAAAPLSGRVADEGGTGVADLEVRLWRNDDGKSWRPVLSTRTGADGAWWMDAPAGTYRLDARMPPGMTGNYADRWYDVAEPLGNGWIASEADSIEVVDDGAYPGLDLVLPVTGGANVRVLGNGTPRGGILVRAEQADDARIHHTDTTKPGCCGTDAHLGMAYFRGLVPSGSYRIWTWDPDGAYEVTFALGPFSIVAGGNADLPDVTLIPAPLDPHEPNDNPAASYASLRDDAGLRQVPPTPWISEPAWLGPRNGDVDWYCLQARRGDRYIATTSTALPGDPDGRPHPWLDLTLAFYTGDGATRLASDDDSGGGFNPLLDTGELPADGRYCFVVTAFGDVDFAGTNQGSSGGYLLAIEAGNRRPTIRTFRNGGPTPAPPGTILLDEGQELVIDADIADPDLDPLEVTVTAIGASGAETTPGGLTVEGNRATFTWLIGETAGADSPYELRFVVSDGELEATARALVGVRSINRVPSTPGLIAPLNSSSVEFEPIQLLWNNSSDGDEDPLTYTVELRYDSQLNPPAQTLTVAEDASGISYAEPTTRIPENTRVFWRVRATDNQGPTSVSPWTDTWMFIVNLENEPPPSPSILKPTNNESVLLRTPAIAVSHVTDPDGDEVSYIVEVSTTATFDPVLTASPSLSAATGATQTEWQVGPALDWGTTYFARAYAIDALGASSAPSSVVTFRVRENSPPPPPDLGGAFEASCGQAVFGANDVDGFEVLVTDLASQDIEIEVELYAVGDEPGEASPLWTTVVAATPGERTLVRFPPGVLTEDQSYQLRVRLRDGSNLSEWTACSFLVNADNAAPGALEIITPVNEARLPTTRTFVEVTVRNATDPDGEQLRVLWCMGTPSLDAMTPGSSCPSPTGFWEQLPQASGETTTFTVPGLRPLTQYVLRACPVDGAGLVGGCDDVRFTTDGQRTAVSAGACDCAHVSPSGARGQAALLLLAVLAMRRRRRQRTP